MKSVIKILSCVLGAVLVMNASLHAQIFAHYDINVGTAVGDDSREVNWGPRAAQDDGTWGVSSESFLGFTLTSMINGVEDGELSYEHATNPANSNNRALGVGGDDSHGHGWGINRNNNSSVIEAIRLDLPAEDALVGVIDEPDMMFRGISQLAFDRLDVADGAIVTISGFVADPLASWEVAPGTAPALSYSAGTLTFETDERDDGGTGFGLISLANLDATLSPTGVSLMFSNDRNTNNANAYGLVGWQYAVIPEPATQALVTGLALLGIVFVLRFRRRAKA